MRTRTRKTLGNDGSAMVFSVVAVMVVSILAAGFLHLALSVTRRLNSTSDALQALNIAEAGLSEAYMGLGVAKTGNVGTAEAPAVFGGGLLWVEATQHSTTMVELKSTGMYGTGRATLGIFCEQSGLRVASLGFFTEDDLRLNPDVRLDSYDSSRGSYADQLNTRLNNQGTIGSNGDISIASGDAVFGDVIYGPTGKLSTANGAIITGGTSARNDVEVLPPVDVPSITLEKPLSYTSGTPMVVPPGDVGYESISIGKDTKLILKGPMNLLTGSFKLAGGAELVFDTTDGPIQMFVTDGLDFSTSSLVTTTTQVTSDTIIYVSAPEGKTVNFGAKSQFYGFIYAPEAEVHISAQYELYGGLAVKSLQLAAQGKMHYDLSLGATLQSQLPLLQGWRVVEIPQQARVSRMDPFQVMGLDRSALRSPADSHEDQVLDIRYVNQNGSTSSYFGPESDFDWGLVKELIYGTRDGVAFFLPEDYSSAIANDPLVDLVNSTLSSKQLRDKLLAASPVSSEALVAACGRDPAMNTSDLDAVLDKNYPLSSDTLLAAIASAALDAGTLTNDLIDNSPLPPEVLSAALARNPPLSASQLTNLLAKQ